MCQQDLDFGCERSVGKMERGRESRRSNGIILVVDDDDAAELQLERDFPSLRRNKSNNNMISLSFHGNSLEDGSQGSEISGLDHQLPSMEHLERTGNCQSSTDSFATAARCLSCRRQRRDDYAGNDSGECHQHQFQKQQNYHEEKNKSKLLYRRIDRASTCLHNNTASESNPSATEIETSSSNSSSSRTLLEAVLSPAESSSSTGTTSPETGLAKITSKRKTEYRQGHLLFSELSRAVWIQLGMLILFSLNLQGVSAVRINSLSVPQIIRNGTEDSVILDCDYSIEDHEKDGLVVKWYFKNQQTQVYQWIPNSNPIILGILKGKVNLDYQADVDDYYKTNRALQILRPTTELTGNWICHVSTFDGDAMEVAKMIVFAPEKEMDMQAVANRQRETVNISCWATRVFPKPQMTFYHEGEEVPDVVVKYDEYDGAYDIRAYKVMEEATLSSLIGSAFDCELIIPSTHYVKRRTTAFEPGSLELKDAMRMSTGQPKVPWDSRRVLIQLMLVAVMSLIL